MKTLISTAPPGIYKNYVSRLYGDSSLAGGYLSALEYARVNHYDVPAFTPIYTPLADALKASGDTHAWRAFANAHSHELRMERDAQNRYAELRAWSLGEPADVIVARNQAATAADKLEAEIRQRGEQLLTQHELQARAKCFAEARKQLEARK